MKKFLIALTAALCSAAAFIPAQANAQASVNIVIGSAPPPVRYEVAPPPRHGYVWTPGFWDWNGRNYVWIGGHWENARPGYFYRQPQWRHEGRQWQLDRGGWYADRRAEIRRPEPHRDMRRDNYGHHDRHDQGRHGDRDRDGVPNRYDRHPNDGRRY